MNLQAIHLPSAGAGACLCHGLRVWSAQTAAERMRGLLARPPLKHDEALLLRPCRLVHTFGMAYPIDLVFIDRAGVVKRIDTAVPRSRVRGCARAWQTLELAAGGAQRHGLAVNDLLPALQKSTRGVFS